VAWGGGVNYFWKENVRKRSKVQWGKWGGRGGKGGENNLVKATSSTIMGERVKKKEKKKRGGGTTSVER